MASKKISLATAIGVGVSSSLAAITPANAVSFSGCGEIRDLRNSPAEAFSGTLTSSGGYCEATFPNSGQAQLILPDGVSDLYGIVVAGGGGSYLYNFVNSPGSTDEAVGYAGNGGGAQAFSWSNLTSDAPIIVEVGKRGENGSADATDGQTGPASPHSSGGNSSVFQAGTSTVLTSLGGAGRTNDPTPLCAFTPYLLTNPVLFVSLGKSGTGAVPQGPNQECEPTGLNGLNPASAPAPNFFSNKVENFGRGGGIYTSAPASNQLHAGEGASVVVDAGLFVNGVQRTARFTDAQDGIVILRYNRVSVATTSSPTYYSPTFGITFDGNGADNLPETALSGQLDKPGYRFVGWNTKADGSGSPFVLGKSIPVSGDMKLFAQWVKNPPTEKGMQRISTFIGDSASLNSALKKQISNWVRIVPADAQILCKGSTSGTRVTAFDKRLARARAQNACDYAVKLRPDVVFKIGVNPSSSTKVSARNVWMSYIS